MATTHHQCVCWGGEGKESRTERSRHVRCSCFAPLIIDCHNLVNVGSSFLNTTLVITAHWWCHRVMGSLPPEGRMQRCNAPSSSLLESWVYTPYCTGSVIHYRWSLVVVDQHWTAGRLRPSHKETKWSEEKSEIIVLELHGLFLSSFVIYH